MCPFQVLNMTGEKNEFFALHSRASMAAIPFILALGFGAAGFAHHRPRRGEQLKSSTVFSREATPEAHLGVPRSAGAGHRGLLHLVPGPPAAHSLISQGVVVLPGISGRVLNTVEIAPRCNIAICEFRVSFRGSPAY